MTDDEKLRAKIANERFKLTAALLNGLAIAAIALGTFRSLIDVGAGFSTLNFVGGLFFGTILHILGLRTLGAIKSEDDQ